eukprot:CAMPEP_0194314848 /NCGR_PEP_ID=MMETSP0171-20130528/11658_1 /TAXON_ID=218684 /ORGANISM="Corethron pennatum, Strain L29A3" /LENGTH=347 /DNA_ID=CAMNT_0039070421 /DNA_START=42 /DNA_END=1082 /DNA_ORIENTATION=+
MTNDYFEDSSNPGDNHKLDSAYEIIIGSNFAPQSIKGTSSNFLLCSRSQKRTVSTDSKVAAERSSRSNKSSRLSNINLDHVNSNATFASGNRSLSNADQCNITSRLHMINDDNADQSNMPTQLNTIDKDVPLEVKINSWITHAKKNFRDNKRDFKHADIRNRAEYNPSPSFTEACFMNDKHDVLTEANKEALSGTTHVHLALKANTTTSAIRSLIDKHPELIYSVDRKGMLLLHLACKHCPQNLDTIKLLIELNPFAVKECTGCKLPVKNDHEYDEASKGAYPIQIALKNGASLGVIQLLAKSYSDILLKTDEFGHNSLHIALKQRLSVEFIHSIITCKPNILNFTD